MVASAQRTGTVVEVGAIARRALSRVGIGEVCAAFPRSVYVNLVDRCLCIGSTAMGSGPLNIRCKMRDPVQATTSLARAGSRVDVEPGRIQLEGVVLAVTGAATWTPDAAPPWSIASLAGGMQALEAQISQRRPCKGLVATLNPAPAGPVTTAVPWKLVDEIERRLVRGFRGEPQAPGSDPALERLLGLGPGLTPSGDDFLCGAMVALTALGEIEARAKIWNTLMPGASERTSRISLAHLSAAAEGLASAALHALLNEVLAGGEHLGPRLEAIDAIGHTSGWDALAGIVVVLRAFSIANDSTGDGRTRLFRSP